MDLKEYIRDVPDFPKKGIIFKDITPLLADANAFSALIDEMHEKVKDLDVDYVVSMEARGFIFGTPLALKLGAGFIPIRKPGKLPYTVKEGVCMKEYGEDRLCIHVDALPKGANVLIVDDLLATGGTVETTAKLVEESNAEIVAMLFAIELGFLKGREKLAGYKVMSVMDY